MSELPIRCSILDVSHCISCHEDEDAGYAPMIEYQEGERWAEVCCWVSHDLEAIENFARQFQRRATSAVTAMATAKASQIKA